MLSFSRTWLPYIYLYGVGGVIFFLGFIMVVKAGSLNRNRPKHRLWFGILFFGFAWYMAIHALSIMLALGFGLRSIVLVILLLVGVGLITLTPVIRQRS